MILLGHLHTHEFAWGGTTDQTGNPWALGRSPGGSSGGSGAALAARMVPAATGTDTCGSLRIPSALCGTSTIKPTRGLVSLRGIVPLAPSLDHAGPMARTLDDCALLLAAMAGAAPDALPGRRAGARPLAGLRLALSPRLAAVTLEPDVADGFEAALAACRALGAEFVDPPAPPVPLDVGAEVLDVLLRRVPRLPPALRRPPRRLPAVDPAVARQERASATSRPSSYLAIQERREETAARFDRWLAEERISALVEPTVPCVAPERGTGYDEAGSDYELISLTHYWDWTGSPVVALPAGVGSRSGLPVGVSLIGPRGGDWQLLDAGIQLQAELGVPAP